MNPIQDILERQVCREILWSRPQAEPFPGRATFQRDQDQQQRRVTDIPHSHPKAERLARTVAALRLFARSEQTAITLWLWSKNES